MLAELRASRLTYRGSPLRARRLRKALGHRIGHAPGLRDVDHWSNGLGVTSVHDLGTREGHAPGLGLEPGDIQLINNYTTPHLTQPLH